MDYQTNNNYNISNREGGCFYLTMLILALSAGVVAYKSCSIDQIFSCSNFNQERLESKAQDFK